MEALASVSSRRAYNATLVIPVFNLDVSADFGRSLQVGPVTFMRGDRLRRSRVRWRLPEPWSYYEDKGTRRHRLIDAEQTYACTFIADESDDACRHGLRQVEGSLDVLRGSQLGRVSRDRRRPFGIRPLAAGHSAYYALAHEGPKGHVRWRNLSPFEPYRIDREWLGFLRNHYFLELLRRTKHQSRNEWEEKLWRAALLAGRSQFAPSAQLSVVFNVMALETLLAMGGVSKSADITDGIFALFGWYTKEQRDPWKKLIASLYKIRSRFVHGERITPPEGRDLLASDRLLCNVLRNLCLLRRVTTQQDFIVLVRRVQYATACGRRPPRPRSLRFQGWFGSDATRTTKTIQDEMWWP